jgi:hypothetical protein
LKALCLLLFGGDETTTSNVLAKNHCAHDEDMRVHTLWGVVCISMKRVLLNKSTSLFKNLINSQQGLKFVDT